MISFRYHLVSMVAVFLALALGIVVGTTALNGPITTDLRKQVNSLKSDRSSLALQVKALQGQVGDAGAFADAYGASIVSGTLSKQNVLVVAMPGASSTTRDGVERDITSAGGKITGRLDLTTSYIDQRRGSDITQLATTVHPGPLTYTVTNDPGVLGGELLAFVLLGRGLPTDLNQVLSAFGQLHMVSVENNSITPTTSVVVVGTGAMAIGDYGAKAELSFVSALQRAGGHVVVAGNAAGATQAGLVSEVRSSGADKSAVATVDNADTSIGQISTVLALADALSSNIGHYGTAKSADSLFPTPSK
ncbi:MAG: hypothetical protein QOG80_741 [Pseudonocardiales bacterium]|nr:hypothetical protein [Pseudonocardiales bacterium]